MSRVAQPALADPRFEPRQSDSRDFSGAESAWGLNRSEALGTRTAEKSILERGTGVGLPDLANENTGCPIKADSRETTNSSLVQVCLMLFI